MHQKSHKIKRIEYQNSPLSSKIHSLISKLTSRMKSLCGKPKKKGIITHLFSRISRCFTSRKELQKSLFVYNLEEIPKIYSLNECADVFNSVEFQTQTISEPGLKQFIFKFKDYALIPIVTQKKNCKISFQEWEELQQVKEEDQAINKTNEMQNYLFKKLFGDNQKQIIKNEEDLEEKEIQEPFHKKIKLNSNIYYNGQFVAMKKIKLIKLANKRKSLKKRIIDLGNIQPLKTTSRIDTDEQLVLELENEMPLNKHSSFDSLMLNANDSFKHAQLELNTYIQAGETQNLQFSSDSEFETEVKLFNNSPLFNFNLEKKVEPFYRPEVQQKSQESAQFLKDSELVDLSPKNQNEESYKPLEKIQVFNLEQQNNDNDQKDLFTSIINQEQQQEQIIGIEKINSSNKELPIIAKEPSVTNDFQKQEDNETNQQKEQIPLFPDKQSPILKQNNDVFHININEQNQKIIEVITKNEKLDNQNEIDRQNFKINDNEVKIQTKEEQIQLRNSSFSCFNPQKPIQLIEKQEQKIDYNYQSPPKKIIENPFLKSSPNLDQAKLNQLFSQQSNQQAQHLFLFKKEPIIFSNTNSDQLFNPPNNNTFINNQAFQTQEQQQQHQQQQPPFNYQSLQLNYQFPTQNQLVPQTSGFDVEPCNQNANISQFGFQSQHFQPIQQQLQNQIPITQMTPQFQAQSIFKQFEGSNLFGLYPQNYSEIFIEHNQNNTSIQQQQSNLFSLDDSTKQSNQQIQNRNSSNKRNNKQRIS